MRLASLMRPIVMLAQNTEDPSDHARRAARIRELRVSYARRAGWVEIPAERLVPRSRWLVDEENDTLYTLFAGATFASGSATLVADRQTDLAFYVVDGEPVVLERQAGSWSAISKRLARRSGAT